MYLAWTHLRWGNPESLWKNPSIVGHPRAVPEQHSVGQRSEWLEPFCFPFSGNLEHLLDLQGVLGVRGGVRVLHILLDHLELFGALLQHLNLGLQLLVMSINWIHILLLFTPRQQTVGNLRRGGSASDKLNIWEPRFQAGYPASRSWLWPSRGCPAGVEIASQSRVGSGWKTCCLRPGTCSRSLTRSWSCPALRWGSCRPSRSASCSACPVASLTSQSQTPTWHSSFFQCQTPGSPAPAAN